MNRKFDSSLLSLLSGGEEKEEKEEKKKAGLDLLTMDGLFGAGRVRWIIEVL